MSFFHSFFSGRWLFLAGLSGRQRGGIVKTSRWEFFFFEVGASVRLTLQCTERKVSPARTCLRVRTLAGDPPCMLQEPPKCRRWKGCVQNERVFCSKVGTNGGVFSSSAKPFGLAADELKENQEVFSFSPFGPGKQNLEGCLSVYTG